MNDSVKVKEILKVADEQERQGFIQTAEVLRWLALSGKEQAGTMAVDEKICGNCKYHKCVGDTGYWRCTNPESDADECYTMYKDTCVDWEAKDGEMA